MDGSSPPSQAETGAGCITQPASRSARRTAAGRYPDDPVIRTMVDTLRRRSAEFAELWDDHHVETGFHHHKIMRHPMVGTLDLNRDTLAVPGRDQYLVCFTPTGDGRSEEALRLLSVVRTQDMTVTLDKE